MLLAESCVDGALSPGHLKKKKDVFLLHAAGRRLVLITHLSIFVTAVRAGCKPNLLRSLVVTQN